MITMDESHGKQRIHITIYYRYNPKIFNSVQIEKIALETRMENYDSLHYDIQLFLEGKKIMSCTVEDLKDRDVMEMDKYNSV